MGSDLPDGFKDDFELVFFIVTVSPQQHCSDSIIRPRALPMLDLKVFEKSASSWEDT